MMQVIRFIALDKYMNSKVSVWDYPRRRKKCRSTEQSILGNLCVCMWYCEPLVSFQVLKFQIIDINLHKLSFHKQETKKEGRRKKNFSVVYFWVIFCFFSSLLALSSYIFLDSGWSSLGDSTMTIVVVIVAVCRCRKITADKRRRQQRCRMAFVLPKVKNCVRDEFTSCAHTKRTSNWSNEV